MQQRPTGITILAVLSAIGGVLGVFGGFTLAFLGSVVGAVAGEGGIGALGFVFGGLTLILGFIGIALAYGFWTLRPWAWPLGVLLELVNIGVAVAQVALGYASFFSAAISVVVAGIILYYLNQPHIKRAFGR
jgi:hypothetical protein